MRYLVLFMLVLLPFTSYTQQAQLRKAEALYERYNYIDAQKVYLRVIDRGYKSAQVYGSLADSYYYQSKYKEATKWYEKLLEAYSDEATPTQYVRGIQAYRSIKEEEKANALIKAYTEKFGTSSGFRKQELNPNYLESISLVNSKVKLKAQAINKPGSNHSPAFLDKDKIVYTSESLDKNRNKNTWAETGYLDLFEADRDLEDGELSNAAPLKGDVNSSLHESSAVFTKDGQTMYFTRNNIIKGKRSVDAQSLIRLKIFKAELQEDASWKVIEDLAFNEDSYSTAYPALNHKEDKLYFSSDMDGTLGMSDIWYVAIHENGGYGEPVHLGNKINTELREAFLFIDSEDRLYFASDGHLGLGGLDIFSTQLDANGKPSFIENIGAPFNTAYDDFAFIIELENERGYFSSNRKERGGANDKLYSFHYECFVELKGHVEDIGLGDFLSGAEVRLLNKKNEVLTKAVVGKDGRYRLELDCGTDYNLVASANGYTTKEYKLYTPDRTSSQLLNIDLDIQGGCETTDLGCRLELQPIYFDFDQSEIRPDAEIELAKILEALVLYPELKIHIESHTDAIGEDAYNLYLSEKRAQATKVWLVDNGLDASRLTAKGYGETQLKNKCDNNTRCSKKQHALNRRSVFVILD